MSSKERSWSRLYALLIEAIHSHIPDHNYPTLLSRHQPSEASATVGALAASTGGQP